MKILKIFGVVVGIHVFALVLIFANPGCSATTKLTPTPADTVVKAEAAPALPPPAMPGTPAPVGGPAGDTLPITPALVAFNPDAPALAPAEAPVRFVPKRPSAPVAAVLVPEPVKEVTPATAYMVKTGDSLWSIAKKHNLAVADLAAANNLPANANLRPGQKLMITAAGSVAGAKSGAAAPVKKAEKRSGGMAPARAAGETVTHTVKSGESLGTIARQYGVRQGDIAVANNIADPAKIRAGMELLIPNAALAAGKAGRGAVKSDGSPKAGESKPAGGADEAAAPIAPVVPIIRIDDGLITPAPKP